MTTERYFYDEKRDRIIIIKQNPCGCHPFDLLKEWGKKWNERSSIGFNNQKEIDEYLKYWVEL